MALCNTFAARPNILMHRSFSDGQKPCANPQRFAGCRVKLFALFPLILLGTPIYAQIDQSLCKQCFKAAQDELKQCLDEAISQVDKVSCAEKQETQTKACTDGECKIERAAESGNKVKDFRTEIEL
jgi:hypothetical protein